jgi:hypothetical protein
MSDGHAASPASQSASQVPVAPTEAADIAEATPSSLSHQSLAQQMQVFLTRTDIQQSRKNRFYLQQVFEMLSELDQHTARQGQLQTALQETQDHIQRIRQNLVAIASDSVAAENEALAIAQARAHLAGLLRDKIVQEFD